MARPGKGYTVLSVETSCDETAAAVVRDGRYALSSVVRSQADIHSRFGGVVPEVACRNHINDLDITVKRALSDAKLSLRDTDAVAVTAGAGLVGALLTGVSYCKALAYAADKPLIAVNHIGGHIAANYIAFPDLKPPFLCLVASGGHTASVFVAGYADLRVLGSTRDDAAGEAFDKIARALGLPYPGGPNLERAAAGGSDDINFFKRPLKPSADYDFSFSGLKTAVVNYMRENFPGGVPPGAARDIAASFQRAALDMLLFNLPRAARETGVRTVCAAGGVAANGVFRKRLSSLCSEIGAECRLPPAALCGDNAAMIGAAAYFDVLSGASAAPLSLNARPSLQIGEKACQSAPRETNSFL